ncbi:hypothetical protein SARC_03429 [Sphaeroforma arctica JP610]|uniref:Inner centromere protein ARK-binding domain-containing protein n=1 Tax=Sphaeroforma arctica JP610 TaxID=667725 RepID=A0A0L0G5X0_9EUKA|nr:hypothetical protein SARC_03429 [Sphaeroforma arctica JP610]KNC84349.1 hypothetical protein SARC_03429 [Sphaeroforma arctica JP610]|eukprot:XP_014158251.1 hypothetical protein SARC_03429 [Sphaeroforma arctica JP610]
MVTNDVDNQVSQAYDDLHSVFKQSEVDLLQEARTHMSWLDQFKLPQNLALPCGVKEEHLERSVAIERDTAPLIDITNAQIEPYTALTKKPANESSGEPGRTINPVSGNGTVRAGAASTVLAGQNLKDSQSHPHTPPAGSTKAAAAPGAKPVRLASDIDIHTPAKRDVGTEGTEKRATPTPKHTRERAEKCAKRMTPRRFGASPCAPNHRTPGTGSRAKRSRALTPQKARGRGAGAGHTGTTLSRYSVPNMGSPASAATSGGLMRGPATGHSKGLSTSKQNENIKDSDKQSEGTPRDVRIAIEIEPAPPYGGAIGAGVDQELTESLNSAHLTETQKVDWHIKGAMASDMIAVERNVSNVGMIEHSSLDNSALNTSALDTSGIVLPRASALDMSGILVFAEAPHVTSVASTAPAHQTPVRSQSDFTKAGAKHIHAVQHMVTDDTFAQTASNVANESLVGVIEPASIEKSTDQVAGMGAKEDHNATVASLDKCPTSSHAEILKADTDGPNTTSAASDTIAHPRRQSSRSIVRLRSLSDSKGSENSDQYDTQVPTKPVYLQPTLGCSSVLDGPSPLLPHTTTTPAIELRKPMNGAEGTVSVVQSLRGGVGSVLQMTQTHVPRGSTTGDLSTQSRGSERIASSSAMGNHCTCTGTALEKGSHGADKSDKPSPPPIHHPCGSNVIVQLGAVLPVSPHSKMDDVESIARTAGEAPDVDWLGENYKRSTRTSDADTSRNSEGTATKSGGTKQDRTDTHAAAHEKNAEQQHGDKQHIPHTRSNNDQHTPAFFDDNGPPQHKGGEAFGTPIEAPAPHHLAESTRIAHFTDDNGYRVGESVRMDNPKRRVAHPVPVSEKIWGEKPQPVRSGSLVRNEAVQKEVGTNPPASIVRVENAQSENSGAIERLDKETADPEKTQYASSPTIAQGKRATQGLPSNGGRLSEAEQHILDVSEAGSMADITVRLRNPLHNANVHPASEGVAASPGATESVAQHEYSFIRTVGGRQGHEMTQSNVSSESSALTATINATFLGTPMVQKTVASTPQASLNGSEIDSNRPHSRGGGTSAMSEESPLTIVAGSMTLGNSRMSIRMCMGGYSRRSSHAYRHRQTSGVQDASFVSRGGSGSNFNTSANSFATPSAVPRPRLSVGKDGVLVQFKEPGAHVGAYKAPAATRTVRSGEVDLDQRTMQAHSAATTIESQTHLAQLFRPSARGLRTAGNGASETAEPDSPRVVEIDATEMDQPHGTKQATDKASARSAVSTMNTDSDSRSKVDIAEPRGERRRSAADTCFGWRETAVKVRPTTRINTQLRQETLTYDTEDGANSGARVYKGTTAREEETIVRKHRAETTYTHHRDRESGLGPMPMRRESGVGPLLTEADDTFADARRQRDPPVAESVEGVEVSKSIQVEESTDGNEEKRPDKIVTTSIPATEQQPGIVKKEERQVAIQISQSQSAADDMDTPKDTVHEMPHNAPEPQADINPKAGVKSEHVVAQRSTSSSAIDLSESNFITPSQTPLQTPAAKPAVLPHATQGAPKPQTPVDEHQYPPPPAQATTTKDKVDAGTVPVLKEGIMPQASVVDKQKPMALKSVRQVQGNASRFTRPPHKDSVAPGPSALPKKKRGYDERKRRQEENIARIQAEKLRKQQEKEEKERQRMAEHLAHVENERQRKIKDKEERERHRKARLKGMKEETHDRKRKILVQSTHPPAEVAGAKKPKLGTHTNRPTQPPSISQKASVPTSGHSRSLLKAPVPVGPITVTATSTTTNITTTTNTVTTTTMPISTAARAEVQTAARAKDNAQIPPMEPATWPHDTDTALHPGTKTGREGDMLERADAPKSAVGHGRSDTLHGMDDGGAADLSSKRKTTEDSRERGTRAPGKAAVTRETGVSEAESVPHRTLLQTKQRETGDQPTDILAHTHTEERLQQDHPLQSPARHAQHAASADARAAKAPGGAEVTHTMTTANSVHTATHIGSRPVGTTGQVLSDANGLEDVQSEVQAYSGENDMDSERLGLVTEHFEETQRKIVHRGSVPGTPVVEPLRGALNFSTTKPAPKGSKSVTAPIQATPMASASSANTSTTEDHSALVRDDITHSSQTLTHDDEFAEQSERLDAEQKEIEAARARVANGKKLSAARFSAVRRATNERPIIKQREPLQNRPMGIETNAIVSAAAKLKESKEAESKRQQEKEEQRIRKLQIDNELARLHRERRELAAKAASIATPQTESSRYKEPADQQFATPTRISPVRTLRADEGPLGSVHHAHASHHDNRASYTLPNPSKSATGQVFRMGLNRAAPPAPPSAKSQSSSRHAMFSTPAAPTNTHQPVVPATHHVFKTPTPVIKRNTSKRKKVVHKDNYNIDDLRSDGTTDDDESPKKKIPDWAQGSSLRAALVDQYLTNSNPAAIFDHVATPKLDQIFSSPGTVKKAKWNNRTSSAMWKYDSPSGGLTKK